MPTGYTAGVQNGTVADFKTFAMQCARAFGALIDMRDSPADAPIPEEQKPSEYHVEAIAKAEGNLAELRNMGLEERAAAWRAARTAAELRRDEYRAERVQQEERYRAMLAEARAWSPPTAEHQGLKDFMVKQLSESIEFDCRPPHYDPTSSVGDSPLEWWDSQIAAVQRDIEYHREEDAKERLRVAGRNRWVNELRRSLGSTAAVA